MQVSLGQRILDLGCATGDKSSMFPPDRFVGIDIDPEAVKFARRRYAREFLQMDAIQLGLQTSSVDWILASGVFHHLNDEDARVALSEASRVLKTSGKMLALTVLRPKSRLNFIGWIVRKLDRGEYIRTYDEYSQSFAEYFKIEKHYPFRTLSWDLAAFVLLQKKTASPDKI